MLIDENIYDFRIDLLIAIIWEKIPLSNEKNFTNIFSFFRKDKGIALLLGCKQLKIPTLWLPRLRMDNASSTPW